MSSHEEVMDNSIKFRDDINNNSKLFIPPSEMNRLDSGFESGSYSSEEHQDRVSRNDADNISVYEDAIEDKNIEPSDQLKSSSTSSSSGFTTQISSSSEQEISQVDGSSSTDNDDQQIKYDIIESVEGLSVSERIRTVISVGIKFFNNKFEEATAAADAHKDHCLHHSHVRTYFAFFKATLTLDPDLIEEAKKQVKKDLEFSGRLRPQRSLAFKLSTFFVRENFDSYSDESLIAELDYAESLFFHALLTFFGKGQTLVSLLKAAIKLNTANQIAKFCHSALKEKKNWDAELSRYTFEAGVLNAVGFSNLVLSNFPTYVLRVLALAGLSGDRQLGLECLQKASKMANQPRYQLTSIIIMVYNIYIEQCLGLSEGDIDWAERVGDNLMNRHPEGGIIKFLNARVALLQSKPHRAISLYKECLSLKSAWKGVDLFCYFDLIWAYAILGDWKTAADYSMTLKDSSTWAHAINMHQFAAFNYMIYEETKDPDILEVIKEAMEQVPKLRKRYAGKTFPAEKYAVEKSNQFFERNFTCVAPAYELFYVWNIFSMTSKDESLLKPICQRLDKSLAELPFDSPVDERCTLLLLKGVSSKYMKDYEDAVKCFNEILENEKELGKSYLVPHASLELGLVYKNLKLIPEARAIIEKARSKSKYLCEALIQLKSHGALRQLDALEAGHDY